MAENTSRGSVKYAEVGEDYLQRRSLKRAFVRVVTETDLGLALRFAIEEFQELNRRGLVFAVSLGFLGDDAATPMQIERFRCHLSTPIEVRRKTTRTRRAR